uniref:Uncharacterized protein n=2 Tax=Denticeps clupeoides TaxID=299321 RepID=A0AAY4C8K4_9TELE
MPSEKFMAVSEQLKSSCNGGASEAGTGDFTKASRGNMRIVRKIRLSGTDEDKLGEEVKFSSSKPPVRPRKQETSESSQDEDLDSFGSDARGDDLFLAISSQGESGEGRGQNGQSDMQGPRKSRTLVLVSSHEPSCPPEGSTLEHKSWYERSEDYDRNQGDKLYDIGKETSQYCCETITSPKIRPNSPLSGRPRIRHSRSLEKHPLKIRSPSPTDSVDSSNTFTIRSAAQSSSFKEDDHRSMSTADLSGRNDLLINGAKGEHQATKRGSRIRMSSAPSNLEPRFKVSDGGPNPSCQESRENQPPLKMISEGSSRVSRSMSMSAIEGRNMRLPKFQQHEERGKKEQADPVNIQEHRGILKVGHLVRKFGKQGSGRSDFTLPSGVHATAQGQLFVVDCGNVRVQVTDLQQNVVQQVTPASSEGSARHCRNFFDVAVNSKGLIALTCAAERALLVFSRHGRHLQTFGSSPVTGTEELEAPRGVTITKLDEFLVADIRRGTLTALKLDAKTGAKVERTVVTGFQRPYLVAACLTSGLMVVSERGIEAGRPPCIRVLEPGWNTIRILGVCSGMGPVLSCPWGICIDKDGDVLVADWGKQHRVVLYPAVGVGRSIVTQGLSSPRGLALLPEGHLVVSDSMNHCIKIYRYK